MKITDIKIGARVIVFFAFIVILNSSLVFYNYLNLSSTEPKIESIYNEGSLSVRYLIEADRDAHQSSLAISNLLDKDYNPAGETRQKLIDTIGENIDQAGKRFGKFEELFIASGGEKSGLFNVYNDNYTNLKGITADITKSIENNNYGTARETYFSKYKKIFNDMRIANEKLTQMSQKKAEDMYKASVADIKKIVLISNIASMALIMFLIAAGIILTRSLTGPIKNIMNIAHKLASGQLAVQIADMSRDEIGKLLGAVKDIAGNIRKVIVEVLDKVNQMASAADELSASSVAFSSNAQDQAASAEEVTATIEEISAATITIADKTRSLDNNIVNMNGKMSRLNNTFRDMNKSAGKTMLLTDSLASKAMEGDKSLMDMKDSITKIGSSSEKVLEIIQLITGISDKINLLSLNAAIEAARAGESGRGFAVVADEISKLADLTASSIGDIDQLIKLNNDEITKGVNAMSGAVVTIGDIIKGVSTIKEMITDLVSTMENELESSAEVMEVIEEIKVFSGELTAAMDEQKNAANEISRSVNNINELTQTFASGAEEMSGNSEELAGIAESLRGSVDFFNV